MGGCNEKMTYHDFTSKNDGKRQSLRSIDSEIDRTAITIRFCFGRNRGETE